MKKKMAVIIVFILIVIPILTSIATADQETELEIEIIGGRKIIRKIYFIVRNIGNETAWHVHISGRIDGGLIIGPRGYSFKGYSSMSPGSEVLHMFIVPGRGLGRIEITIIAHADNTDIVNATLNGFILGRFVILPDFVAYS